MPTPQSEGRMHAAPSAPAPAGLHANFGDAQVGTHVRLAPQRAVSCGDAALHPAAPPLPPADDAPAPPAPPALVVEVVVPVDPPDPPALLDDVVVALVDGAVPAAP